MSGGSQSMLSYTDIKEVLDKALEAEKGLLLTHKDVRAATRFIFRANSFRALTRKENLVVYPDPQHPLHGRCVYDTLSLRRIGEKVRVEKIILDAEIEELKD